MKVKDLIEELKKLNGDLPVLYWDDKYSCYFEADYIRILDRKDDNFIHNKTIDKGVEIL